MLWNPAGSGRASPRARVRIPDHADHRFHLMADRRFHGMPISDSTMPIADSRAFFHPRRRFPERGEEALYPAPPPSRVARPEPEWPDVHQRHKGVTLQLLWLEYRAAHTPSCA